MKRKACSLTPLFDHYAHPRPVDWAVHFNRKAPLVVEIGFGMGEVLTRHAQTRPDQNFVGIEQHWERIYKTMKAMDRVGLRRDNVRILDMDARVAFDRLFDQQSIDHIYCLFPCPWPKKSHIKHRLFARNFLLMLNSRLKTGAQMYFVTDHKPYFQWVREEVDQSYFDVQTSSIQPQFGTKFEKKWLAEGQNAFFELVLTKQKHFNREAAQDRDMKSYQFTHFDPDHFSFENVKDEVSIILKDRIYDPDQKRLKLMFIVNEQHLTQYFWVTVMYKKDRWYMYKSDGQHFFPTPGIVQTLKETAQQIKSMSTV